jgi:hypothetical protein
MVFLLDCVQRYLLGEHAVVALPYPVQTLLKS